MRKACGVHERELRVRATRPRIPENFIARLKVSHAVADSDYPSGDVPSGDPWKLQLEHLTQEPSGATGIDAVHAGEVILHEHLSETGLRLWRFFHLQRLFITVNSQCFHGFFSLRFFSTPCAIRFSAIRQRFHGQMPRTSWGHARAALKHVLLLRPLMRIRARHIPETSRACHTQAIQGNRHSSVFPSRRSHALYMRSAC